MPQYDDTDRGVLFKNDRKDSDKHPDYKGQINVGGREYWLSCWIKKAQQTGKPYLSLSVQPKDDNSAATSTAVEPDVPIASPEDDIPF